MTADAMEKEVRRIVAELPGEMSSRLEEVSFFIQDGPDHVTRIEAGLSPDDDLLGFYRGIPLPERTGDLLPDLPDAIFLFRTAILREARYSRTPIEQVLRETLLHEIAHFFGYDDDELEQLGVY